jgi:hypothetical protein
MYAPTKAIIDQVASTYRLVLPRSTEEERAELEIDLDRLHGQLRFFALATAGQEEAEEVSTYLRWRMAEAAA